MRRRYNKSLDIKKITNSSMKIQKTEKNYLVKVWDTNMIEVSKLYDGKINQNSVTIIKSFARQVFKNEPIQRLSDIVEYSQLDILQYSFETLPISKEVYFKVKNESNQTILVVKCSVERTSLTKLFGNSIGLSEVKNDIKNVINDVTNIVQIDENLVCEAFSDFEFLTHEKHVPVKLILRNETYDDLSIEMYREEFKRLSLNFKVQKLTAAKHFSSKVKKEHKVTFKDVYCMDEIIEQFKEIGELFNNSKSFQEKGIHIPYGVLLVGAPGSGKTLLTRAFANEYGIKIIEPKLNFGFESSAQSIDWKATFDAARYKKPSIIFIDEIDKIKINQELFYEMDGQISNNGVLVIASANDISKIHPAIFRPGRFDRKIYFQPLSNEVKTTMLLKTLEKCQIPYDLDIAYIAEFMGNVNGAYIDTYVNEARIKMHLKGIEVLQNELLLSVIETVNQGYAMPYKVTDEELYQTMVHEAGHAVVALALYGKDAITKIDVRNNYHSLGRVQLSSKLPMHNQSAILNQVKINLGGIVAEKIVLKEAGFGASSDIYKVRKILESMITDNGITDLKSSGAKMFLSSGVYGTEKSKDAVIEMANDMINDCEKEVIEIIQNNLELLNEIVSKLKVKPLLLKEDIYELNISDNFITQNSKQEEIFLNKV